jgi:hypothetical protein
MKHGSKDPNDTLTTSAPDLLDIALLLAIRDYQCVFHGSFFEANVFLAYAAEDRPELFKDTAHPSLTTCIVGARRLADSARADKASAKRALRNADRLVERGLVSSPDFNLTL